MLMNKRAEQNAKEKVENKVELMKGDKLRKAVLFWLTFLASFVYIFWRLFFTLPLAYGIISVICGVLLWACESVTVLETFTHFWNVQRLKIPEMPEIPDDMFPTIDVMIATHNETPELLFKTINGCKYMKYPDPGKVHIHLCDDNNREEMRQLAEHMGIHYWGFDGNQFAKAGNLNYALARTSSELLAIFDADMIPTSDFLLETVPYFFADQMIKEDGVWRRRREDELKEGQKLAYVQTQQSFYNPDPLQRNLYMENSAPNEQDYFYRSVNVARMNSDSAAFAGSNTVFTRESLVAVDGFATHSITEDFATGIAILGKGYTSMALAKELAHGLSPEDVYGFIKQRQRWSRGAAQGIMTKKFWFSGLSIKAKWGFWVAYCYWWTFVRRFVFIMCPILYGVFGIRVADVTFTQLVAVWLPYYIIYNLGLTFMSGQTTSGLWSDRIDTIQFPYMMGSIIKGTLMIPQKKFVVTSKERQSGRNSNIRLAWPHIVLTLLSLLTALVCLHDIFIYENDGSIIVLFWAVYNILALLCAIVYYFGRANSRYSERIAVPIPATLYSDGRSLHGTTADLSEGGLAVFLNAPEYLPYDKDFEADISYKEYKANFKVSVRQVRQIEDKWQYSLVITAIEEAEKKEYLQILYDRVHLFPRVIDAGIVKDFRTIYRGLTAKTVRGERRLPRVTLGITLPTSEAGAVEVINFNFQYLLLRGSKKLPERLSVMFPGDVTVTCVLDHELNKRSSFLNQETLYQVAEWETLAMNPQLRASLKELAKPMDKE